jgi:hypothetical protein
MSLMKSLMNLGINRRLWSIVFRCLLLASACAAVTQVQASAYQDDPKEFDTQIQKYLALQKKAVGSVPSIPRENADAALIAKHEKQVADAIRAARPNAKQGEIFTPGVRRLITMTLKQTLEGKEGAAAKATILGDGNPKAEGSPEPVNLAVNSTYPISAPFSTVPPSVLMALPPLPKELEFRFVGRNLILRDTKANMIVDVLPEAF